MQERTRDCGHRRRGVFTLSLAGVLLWGGVAASGALATTVVQLSDSALADSAVRIVHGVVTDRTAHALPDRTGYYTEYRLRVTEALKGVAKGTREVVFREWGARMPTGEGYWIPGTGELKIGEEVVVFLGAIDTKTQVGFTTGLAQGKFHVRTEGGQKVATRSFKGLSLLDPDGAPADPDARSRKLVDLKRQIRARLHARMKQQPSQGANDGR